MIASRRPALKEVHMTSLRNTSRVLPLSLLALAAPLLWVVPAIVHPVGEPYGGIEHETGRWLFVHLAQLVLAPFLAACVWMLLAGLESAAARLARAALVVWLVFFSAFDAVAGIATGVLSRHANSLTGEEREGVVGAIDFLFDDSQLVGGGFSVLGNLGHGAWIVVAIAAAVALHQAHAPRAAVAATLLSVLFASHSGLGAAVGLVAIFVAARVVVGTRSAAATPSQPAEAASGTSGTQAA
jgi:hypothetical protein